MKVEERGHTIVIKDTESDVQAFLEKVTSQHNSYKNHNLVLDISQDKTVDITSLKLFTPLSKNHKKGKKSFVIVANAIDFNRVPATLLVVPTLLEAHDMIEMEEIERDLGF